MVLAVVSAAAAPAAAEQTVALEVLACLLLALTRLEATFFLSWVVEYVIASNSVYDTC